MPVLKRSSDYNAPAATREELEAEVERLREALQHIADWQLGEAAAAEFMRNHARRVLDA